MENYRDNHHDDAYEKIHPEACRGLYRIRYCGRHFQRLLEAGVDLSRWEQCNLPLGLLGTCDEFECSAKAAYQEIRMNSLFKLRPGSAELDDEEEPWQI